MAKSAAELSDPDTAPEDFGPYGELASDALCREAERWLHREARLLDTEQFDTWLLEMVHPEVRYLIESREQRFRKERRYRQVATVPIFDDNYAFLQTRVTQCSSGMYWRMDPPEHYRRLVTNVEAFETGRDDRLAVRSNCLATRTRRVYEIDTFIYCREDLLARSDAGQWQLLQRHIEMDERCVSGRNMVMLL